MYVCTYSRSPRRRNGEKRGAEHSMENHLCSEDGPHNHQSIIGSDSENPSNSTNLRAFPTAANPVLISKNKPDYQSLTSKNKIGRLTKNSLSGMFISADLVLIFRLLAFLIFCAFFLNLGILRYKQV